MVAKKIKAQWSLRIPQPMYDELHEHLFPGDHDEHGAVIEAGLSRVGNKHILLARRLIKARDGINWIPGRRGYRMMPARYVTERVRQCRSEKLVYLAVHNHGGSDHVAFSETDLETHRRGFPALLDIVQDRPVGALVFAENAVAGEIWTPSGEVHELDYVTILGPARRQLQASPQIVPEAAAHNYHRQVLLFGARGQSILSQQRVVIVGLGGVGILIAEYLGRLGIGEITLIDPDYIDPTNLPRMVHATTFDAMSWLVDRARPSWLRRLGKRFATPKVRHAAKIIHRANSQCRVYQIRENMEHPAAIEALKSADYIFLAADSHRARLIINAIAYQYLIPCSQVGSRIQSDSKTGALHHVHTIVRWLLPENGCFHCNAQISPARIQEESISQSMLKRQKYTDEVDLAAPSVITLNAVGASQAVNDYLFHVTGLAASDAFSGFLRTHPIQRRTEMLSLRHDLRCPDCSAAAESRFARGDGPALPLI